MIKQNLLFALQAIALASLAVNLSAQTYVYDEVGRLEKVLYVNGTGVSYSYDGSDNITLIQSIAIPEAVQGVSFVPSSPGKADLTWSHNGSVTAFKIQSKRVGTDAWSDLSLIEDPNARSLLVNLGLNPSEELSFRIIALGSSGEESALSDTLRQPPLTPLFVTTDKDENDSSLGLGEGDSLREIIKRAVPGSTVKFASHLTGLTIVLGGSELQITKGLTIDASALPDRITIDANGQSRVFAVTTTETVLLKGLKITGGDSPLGGAVINRGGFLTLDECEVTNSISSNFGGGLYNISGGSLVLEQTSVSGNIANEGGGIYNADGALQLRFSNIARNSATDGGGIYHAGTSLIVDRSAVFANEATHNGGGLFNNGADTLLENCTLTGNASADNTGGGISNQSSFAIIARHCTITENTGTGIVTAASTDLTLDNSVVANNFNTLNAPLDLAGDFIAVAANLVRVRSGSLLSGPAPLTSDPLLGAFGSYGGRSPSMPPLAGSPTLEAGVVTANTPSTDQDSSFRPHGDSPELGSIESRLSSETSLDWLTSSARTLSPVFRSPLTAYTAVVPKQSATIAVRPAAGQFGQTIEVRINDGAFSVVNSKEASAELPLSAGENTVEVRVTAQNGVATKIYAISVIRGVPSATNTELEALSSNPGTLSPGFTPETRIYHTVVPNGTTTTSITANTANSNATLKVRSNFGSFSPLTPGAASGPLLLHVGRNAIDIEVTAQDGANTSIHSINVIREYPPESNALLDSLSVGAGGLNPIFNPGVSVYKIEVPESVTTTTVSATIAEQSATLQTRINAGSFSNLTSGAASTPLPLDPGANIIEVKSTAQDGLTVQSYTLIVTRIVETLDWISEAGDGASTKASMSSDCRYVTFASRARNLVPGNINNNEHIYVYDRIDDSMRLISVSDGGQQGDRNSTDPVISADGLFVAFQSEARNLVPNDSNGTNDPSQGRDIFVYDLTLGTIERVSIGDNEGESNGASSEPSISGDGRYIAFTSGANNLVSGFSNGEVNVYVRDRTEQTTAGISVPFSGYSANRNSLNSAVSADGSYVAFEFSVDKSVGDTPGYQYRDIYLYGRSTGIIQRITGTLIGPDADGTQSSSPSISADGRYVAFVSNLENIDFYDTNDALDVFVFDRIEGATRRVSANGSSGGQSFKDSTNPSISGDGNYVAFESFASNLVVDDTNDAKDIFITNLNTGEIVLASVTPDGTQGDEDSLLPWLSLDGRCVVFDSRSSTFNLSDSNSVSDIFIASSASIDPSPLTSLARLTSDLGELTPSENAFSASATDGANTVTLGLYPADPDATIQASINQGAFAFLPSNAVSTLALESGANSIEIKVTAANGSATQSYILTITRKAAEPSLLSNAEIASLETNVGSLSPTFASEVLLYSTDVSTETTTATISPTLTVANASLTVNGVTVQSGGTSNPISLGIGSNNIVATVTALDGVTKRTYILEITRAEDLSIRINETQVLLDAGSNLRVTWKSVSNAKYQIEISSDLKAWLPLGSLVQSQGESTTADINLEDAVEGKLFIRISQQ